MDRRTFLKTTAGAGAIVATGGLATPAISQNAAAKTLRFVPQANLANFDPFWTTQDAERNAKTDPFKQIDDYIGSGPMKFVRRDWVPGAKAAFEKFADYISRQEKASWLAGGKNMLVDRIEWVIMPDPATASAALQNGEVDWWENPIADLVPLLKKNRNVSVDIADPLGN